MPVNIMSQNHDLAQYYGELHKGRMHGHGTYWFDSGTKYIGGFKDGMFHGEGTLFFQNGARYIGTWENGKEQEGRYIFSDGLQYEPAEWQYCTEHIDRRFYPELVEGLRPADRYLRSPKCDDLGKPLRYIPDGCYDTCDGVYDPKRRVVLRYGKDKEDPVGDFFRSATDDEHDWIVRTCRKGWDEVVGFRKNQ